MEKKNQRSQVQQYISGFTSKTSSSTVMALWQTDLFSVQVSLRQMASPWESLQKWVKRLPGASSLHGNEFTFSSIPKFLIPGNTCSLTWGCLAQKRYFSSFLCSLDFVNLSLPVGKKWRGLPTTEEGIGSLRWEFGLLVKNKTHRLWL